MIPFLEHISADANISPYWAITFYAEEYALIVQDLHGQKSRIRKFGNGNNFETGSAFSYDTRVPETREVEKSIHVLLEFFQSLMRN